MTVRKMTIRLDPAERRTLVRLYLAKRIATDRYQHRRADLEALTNSFNRVADRSDTPEEVLHFMRTRRKKNDWPTLDGDHLRLPTLAGQVISDENVDRLVQVYVAIGIAVDNFAHDADLASRLEQEFLIATGLRVRGTDLATVLMELRKDGRLPHVGRSRPTPGGFTDLDEASGM